MSWLDVLSRGDIVVFAIPIVAILTGGIIVIVKLVIAHRERMAMIEQGLHPDYPPEEEPFEEGKVPGDLSTSPGPSKERR